MKAIVGLIAMVAGLYMILLALSKLLFDNAKDNQEHRDKRTETDGS